MNNKNQISNVNRINMFDSLSLPELEWEAGVVEPHKLTAVAHFVNWTADVNDPIMMEMQRQTSRKVQSEKNANNTRLHKN